MKPSEPVTAGVSPAAMLDALPIPVSYLDTQLVYRQCNRAAAEALGRPCSEIIGRRLDEIVGADTEIYRAVSEVIETGEPFSRALEFAPPDQPDVRGYYIVSYVPDRDETGRIIGVFAEGFDVTELVRTREQARLAFEHSEERFRALVTASTDVLYRMSADWREMHHLRSERFLADTEESSVDWIHSYIPEEEQPRVVEAIDEAIRTKGTFELEHQVFRADGTIGWTYSRAVPILDESGEITECFGWAADITDRRRAEIALRDERHKALIHAERMSLLKELAEIGASSLKEGEAAGRLTSALVRSLGAKAAFIWEADDDGAFLVPIGGTGVPPEEVAKLYGPVGVDSETTTAAVFRSGKPACFRDSESDPSIADRLRVFNRTMGYRAGAALPIVVRGTTIGVLSIVWAEPREFDAERMSFLESVASEAALGIRAGRLFEAERRASQQARLELMTTRLLLRAAEVLPSALELGDALTRAADLVLDFTGIDRAFINLIDTQRRLLTPVVATGGLASPEGTTIDFEQLSATALKAIEAKTTAILDYELPALPEKDREIARANNCKVALFVPMLFRGELVGHITVDEPGKRHVFGEREIELVEGVASQAALVVRNAQLLEERTRQAESAEALNRINSAIHSTLDFDSIMERVVVDATQAAGLDGMAIHVLEQDRWRFAYSYGLPAQLRELRLTREDAPLSEMVLREGQTLVIADARADERANRELMGQFDIAALMALPLIVRGDPIGVLFAGCYGPGRTLAPRQVDFMSKVASTLSLALENARLYQNEHRIADRLQEALLTLPEDVPGVEFAHAYRAATEAERVGGDFYDLFELEGGKVGIIIGDVAGKGLDAAMLTSLAKNTIRAHANERGKTPAHTLDLTNEVVYKSTPSETFMTVFFGLLDPETGRLTYSSAGHTTSAIARSDGNVVGLAATGPLLGAFRDVPFGEAQVELGREELLFLYTDGLTEARREGELYGEERLFALLSTLTKGSIEEAVNAVVREVDEYSRVGLQDDLAVLALRRN